MNLDPASPSSNPKSATENASGIWDSYHSQKTRTPAGEERKDLVASQLGVKNLSENFQRQMPRRWQDGEVYAPHDLSEVEARKWKKVSNVQRDLVDMLGLRPVDMYSVSALPLLGGYEPLAGDAALGASSQGGPPVRNRLAGFLLTRFCVCPRTSQLFPNSLPPTAASRREASLG